MICMHLPHLKHVLWNLYPPATRSSAAYTDLPHFGHFGLSTGTKGILSDFIGCNWNSKSNKQKLDYLRISIFFLLHNFDLKWKCEIPFGKNYK